MVASLALAALLVLLEPDRSLGVTTRYTMSPEWRAKNVTHWCNYFIAAWPCYNQYQCNSCYRAHKVAVPVWQGPGVKQHLSVPEYEDYAGPSCEELNTDYDGCILCNDLLAYESPGVESPSASPPESGPNGTVIPQPSWGDDCFVPVEDESCAACKQYARCHVAHIANSCAGNFDNPNCTVCKNEAATQCGYCFLDDCLLHQEAVHCFGDGWCASCDAGPACADSSSDLYRGEACEGCKDTWPLRHCFETSPPPPPQPPLAPGSVPACSPGWSRGKDAFDSKCYRLTGLVEDGRDCASACQAMVGESRQNTTNVRPACVRSREEYDFLYDEFGKTNGIFAMWHENGHHVELADEYVYKVITPLWWSLRAPAESSGYDDFSNPDGCWIQQGDNDTESTPFTPHFFRLATPYTNGHVVPYKNRMASQAAYFAAERGEQCAVR